jgi:hypothetical protein
MNETRLLTIDAVINLALGLLLILFPHNVVRWLGVPVPDTTFYANILGAVLFGIGLALLIERFHFLEMQGLGLDGAIVVNICGAGALALWLIFGDLQIPTRGYLFLGAIAVLILGLGMVEWVARWGKPGR